MEQRWTDDALAIAAELAGVVDRDWIAVNGLSWAGHPRMNTGEPREGKRLPPVPNWNAPLGHCRWCGRHDHQVEWHQGGDRMVSGWWHPGCLRDYGIAVSSRAQRYALEKRDRGICACCGANRERWEAEQSWAASVIRWEPPKRGPWKWWDDEWDEEFPCSIVKPVRPPRPKLPAWIDWEAEHVIPLHKVDRSLPWEQLIRFWSLDNLQTLCVLCHRRKSAEEARGRADSRRPLLSMMAGPSLPLDLPRPEQ